MSYTVRWLANCHTLGTVFCLTCLIRTHNLTVWFLTLYVTNCIFGLLAGCVTLGGLTHWLTYCITSGVITFPRTLGMTFGGNLGKNAGEEKRKD